MKTRTTLRPGQKGAKGLSEKYGSRLIAVRYHYDAENKRRIKSVELVEEAVTWKMRATPSPNKIVTVNLGAIDANFRRKILSVGGRPTADGLGWRIRYGVVVKLGLLSKVVKHLHS
jgi:hypothetical protein